MQSRIRCFRSSYFEWRVSCTLVLADGSPRALSSLLVQHQTSRRARWCPRNNRKTPCRDVHENLRCVGNCSKRHCAWRRSIWKRRAASKLFPNFRYRQVLLAHVVFHSPDMAAPDSILRGYVQWRSCEGGGAIVEPTTTAESKEQQIWRQNTYFNLKN